MPRKDLLEGAVIFGTAQGQHLVAVNLIPPGPRAFEPHMTNALVSRFDPPAAPAVDLVSRL